MFIDVVKGQFSFPDLKMRGYSLGEIDGNQIKIKNCWKTDAGEEIYDLNDLKWAPLSDIENLRNSYLGMVGLRNVFAE